jgi:hypothetical protein
MLTSTFTRRSRVTYFTMILIVIGLGLASRRYSEVLPDFISRYAEDTLWALMVFLVIGLLSPSLSTWKVAAIALLFSISCYPALKGETCQSEVEQTKPLVRVA